MSVLPIPTRITTQMQNAQMLGGMLGTQSALAKVEQQISTGQQLTAPSDDPAAATGIMQLNNQISGATQFDSNLNFASGFLNTADSTLTSVSSLINQANSIASAQVGATTSATQRAGQASVVDSLITQALALANTQYQGAAVFGGAASAQNPVVAAAGGYKFQGSSQPQGILTPNGSTINYSVDGSNIFGGSSQITGYQNLTPSLTANTQISDLAGATNKGVNLGVISVTSGSSTFSVNLSKAATIGDVQADLQSAITAAGSAATVGISAGHLTVTADPSAALSISDTGAGTTASDLGITGSAVAGATITGANLTPQITATTLLSTLRNGAGIDPSGFILTNGTSTSTINLSGLSTVQDLINKIDSSGTGAQASINAAGNGLNITNPISGVSLSVGENGGTTAQELGIRSFQPNTLLSSFNSGMGITPIGATTDGPTGAITVTKTDGTSFNVTVDGVSTPSAQLINAINSATGNTTVTAALNASGNGITLTDTSVGSGNLSVTQAPSYVSNGSDLGILKTGSGGTLVGSNITLSTDDLRITRQDGTSFTVNFDGAKTVQDVLNALNNADGNAAGASHVTASLATTGNGIVLTDPTSGSGVLSVSTLNSSEVAGQLGIATSAASATPGVINGADTNAIPSQGLFSALQQLRQALANNDTTGIQNAATLLTQAASSVQQVLGGVAGREQEVANFQTQNSDYQTQLQKNLSDLSSTDMTTAATQLQSLQTSYQASLQIAALTSQNMNLMNFVQ